MKELNNFNKHISELISPIMKEKGFKKKNLRFRRQNGKYFEEIYIQRSQFNLSGCENLFFINLYWYNSNDYNNWFYQERLPNKPKSKCPARYKAYYADFSEEFRNTFSKNEENEIHNYRRETEWYYTNEKDLEILLNTLAELINLYIDEIFNTMEKNFDESKIFGEKKISYEDHKELHKQYINTISYCTCTEK